MTAPPVPLDSAHREFDSALVHLPAEHRLSMPALTCLVFFTTCGGAFALEPLIGAVGPGWAVVFIVVTPLVWSLPTSLMVAELATLMPEEGGYYVWVRQALGPFWAVQQACWVMGSGVVWLAMFPLLLVTYLAFLIPAIGPSADASHPWLGPLLRWLIALLVIVTGAAINLRGAREVGGSAKINAGIVLGAFAVMLIVWMERFGAPGAAVAIVSRDLRANHGNALLLGLSYVIFNYSNWDNVSTYAGEVDQPQRSYPQAIGIALLAAVVCYVLPVMAGITVTTRPDIWSADAGWPVIAQMIGGNWLGGVIAAAGMVSMWGLFTAQLLYVSRLPLVMAVDGWLPKIFAQVSPGTAVPKLATVVFAAIGAVFAALSFGSLAIISALLYSGALTLEFLSLIVLRIRRPNAPRAFRVPGGWLGMAYVCVTPFAFCALVLYAMLRDWKSFPGQLFTVGALIVAGVALYRVRRKTAVGRELPPQTAAGH